MPRDTRSTDRCTRFESADLVHVCGCVHLSYALHLILALSPSTPSLRPFLERFSSREIGESKRMENIGDCLEEMLSEGVLFVSFA